jgi:cell pole-organizing protein PopZ
MSIEDILKSIKGVINERKHLNYNNNDEDVLELTEIMGAEDKEEEINEDEDSFNSNEESLISSKFASETSDILKNFAHTVKDQDFETSSSSKNALEELIIEILKPELRRWLNENLPSLVKQLVEREIKKLMPSNKK